MNEYWWILAIQAFCVSVWTLGFFFPNDIKNILEFHWRLHWTCRSHFVIKLVILPAPEHKRAFHLPGSFSFLHSFQVLLLWRSFISLIRLISKYLGFFLKLLWIIFLSPDFFFFANSEKLIFICEFYILLLCWSIYQI